MKILILLSIFISLNAFSQSKKPVYNDKDKNNWHIVIRSIDDYKKTFLFIPINNQRKIQIDKNISCEIGLEKETFDEITMMFIKTAKCIDASTNTQIYLESIGLKSRTVTSSIVKKYPIGTMRARLQLEIKN